MRRPALLDGSGLRDAFAAAAAHLRESARAVDAINVYPVPDGDTGTNMFATLREAVDRKARPCAYGPEFRQLDFWIGEWDVTSSGAPAGESHVEKMLGECVIFESWTGARGMVGKSFNLWDATNKEWRQTWVDSTGGLHEYHGAFGGGKMVYLADRLQAGPTGALQPTKLRMTFFDEGGTVRQLGEQSTDGGRTWAVSYDLLYTRKNR
jgi:hypothetical protein